MGLRLSPLQGDAMPSTVMTADPSKQSWRVDVISDTHGRLSPELLDALEGADLIVHAGDFTSSTDYQTLRRIAPMQACLGNNDWESDYGPEVKRMTRFTYAGLTFQVVHYEERLNIGSSDIAVCGHSHRPFVRHEGATLVINPGSPTFPRSAQGPTMGRIILEAGEGGKATIASAEIIELNPKGEEYSPWARFFKQI